MTRELTNTEANTLDAFDDNAEAFHDEITEWLTVLGILCQANSIDKGFWDEPRNKGAMVALIHSEVSEMFEGIRKPDLMSEKCPELTLEEEEWADTLIRLFDYGRGHKLRMASAFILKMRYNRGRERMHGKLL